MGMAHTQYQRYALRSALGYNISFDLVDQVTVSHLKFLRVSVWEALGLPTFPGVCIPCYPADNRLCHSFWFANKNSNG